MTEWRLQDSRLLGSATRKRWSGRFLAEGGDSGEALQVTVSYGREAAEGERRPTPADGDRVQRLAEATIRIPALGEVTLSARVENIPSCEAVHPPPVTLSYSLVLTAAPGPGIAGERTFQGLTIVREQGVRMQEDEFHPADPLQHLHRLPPKIRGEIDTLRAGEEGAVSALDIVELARWMADRTEPLSPPHEEIRLVSLALRVRGETGEIPVEYRSGLGWVAHLPEEEEGELTLLPEYRYLRHLPWLDRLETDGWPLPSCALVKLAGEYGRTLARADPGGEEGRFRVEWAGPEGWREARLEAVFPLEPPGDEPRLDVELRRPVVEPPERPAPPAADVRGPIIPLAGESDDEVLFSHPEQRIVVPWGNGDGTGELLGEVRRVYKAALRRGIEEIGAQAAPVEERVARMEAFLDRWGEHLYASHKGGWLQDFEGEMERDRKEAVRRVSSPG